MTHRVRSRPRRASVERGAKPTVITAAALVCLTFSSAAEATGIFDVSNEGYSEIYNPREIESARAAGAGRVTVIPLDGAVATWWSPAFLAFQSNRALDLSDADLSLLSNRDEGYVRSATLSGPLPFGSEKLAVGFGFKRLSWSFPRSTPFYPYGDGSTVDLVQHAYALALGYPATRTLGVGVTLEYLSDRIDDESGRAFSMGFGVAYARPMRFGPSESEAGARSGARVGVGQLVVTPRVGVSLLHVGEKLNYGGAPDGYDLARQLRGGIGFGVAFEPPPGTRAFGRRRLRQFDLTTALEVYFPAVEWEQVSQKRMLLHMGAELTLFGMISGRIGFIDDDRQTDNRFDYHPRDNTYGFGVALPSVLPADVRVDWASVPDAREDRIGRLTLSVVLREH